MITLTSILDNDFYKFTMQQAVVKLFPRARARYRFINRGHHVFPPGFENALRQSVANMAQLKLTVEEKEWLTITCPYLDPVYLDFLQGYCYDPAEVSIRQEGNELSVFIEGYWYRTILWEVPLLFLISELFYRLQKLDAEPEKMIEEKTLAKIKALDSLGVTVADFGTRRRHSYAVQQLVVRTLKSSMKNFVGTSNVHLAMTNGIKPIGTHAHEWFMFHAARYGYKMANTMALENWVKVFRGDLGIALSDTFTTDEFYEVFDKKFAKLFDGVRHDSGDPLQFADKTIRHYESMGINPLTKTIIFSDALDYEKVKRITDHCRNRIGISFGIGTNLTNDVGLKPMNIVLKMTEALPEAESWTPVVKLSDEKGKYTGDAASIDLARKVLMIRD